MCAGPDVKEVPATTFCGKNLAVNADPWALQPLAAGMSFETSSNQSVRTPMKKYLFLFLCLCSLDQLVLADMLWKDAAELVIGGRGWKDVIGTYRRLPDAAKGNVPDSVWRLGSHTAGLVVQFETDSQQIALQWTLTSSNLSMPHMPATGVSGIDLYRKDENGRWFYVLNARPTGKKNTATINTGNTSSQMRQYMIYLPLYNGVESLQIGVSEGSTFAQSAGTKARPIVYYGTSIAQGACASRPGMAFTAILQRRLDRDTVNLGFSGSGKMEPEVADLIAQIDASVFVVDCLWNLSGTDSEVIEHRVLNLAQTLRNAHPDTPILFVEQSSFKGPFPTGPTRAQRSAIDRLRSQGMQNIHVVPADDLVGSDGDGTVDGCHPNDLGMARHADVLGPVLEGLLK